MRASNFTGNGRSFGALDAQARDMVDRVGTLEELLQTAPALNGGSGRGRLSAGAVETRRLAVLADAGATERELAEQLAVVDAVTAAERRLPAGRTPDTRAKADEQAILAALSWD